MEMERKELQEQAQETAPTMREAAHRLKSDVQEMGTRLATAGRAAARTGIERADEFAHDRPFFMAAAAFAAGAFVGWLLTRRT
ncbi:MAG: hypothetical protein HYY16_03945 [Planctomycetes bacterium]|nr:hypothetical protein [Planctomycetota bacterium]